MPAGRTIALGALVLALGVGATFLALRPSAEAPEVESAAGPPDAAAARLLAARSAPPAKESAAVALSTFLGRVVDADGRPIAGAAVTAREIVSPSWVQVRRGAHAVATSRADGGFVVRVGMERGLADVVASASGYATVTVERVAPDRSVNLRLAREGVLRGRVIDERGKPIPGASVRAFRVLGRDHLDTVAATTAGDGEFRLGGFGKSRGADAVMRSPLLVVRAEGFGGAERVGPFPEEGEDLRQDVLLLSARPLDVLVLDADSGTPVGGALANVGWGGWFDVSSSEESRPPVPHPVPYLDEGTTDERGVCTLGGVPTQIAPDQRLVVRAWKRGWTRESTVVLARTDGPSSPVVVKLWPAAVVRGRVVDAEGGPVARTYVRGSYLDSWPVPVDGALPGALVLSDEDGRYVFAEMRATAAGTGRQWVSTSGRGELRSGGREAGLSQEIQVEVRPRAGEEATAPDLVVGKPRVTSSARVLVVDAEGGPVPDSRVRGGIDEERTDASGRAVVHWSTAPPPEWVRPTPDEAAGDRAIGVRAAGFARMTVHCRPSVNSPPDVRIVLARGLRLEGRVREADGRPVGAAVVWVRCADPEGSVSVETVSRHDGTFAVDDLPAAPCKVFASLENVRGSLEVEATPGGAPVEVTIAPDVLRRATLAATLVAEEDGSPLVDGRVAVLSDPRPPYPRVPTPRDAPGVETVRGVPIGTWDVTGTASGRLPVTRSVVFTEGETARVRLALPRGTRATFHLVVPAEAREAVLGGGMASEPVRVARVDAGWEDPGASAVEALRPDDDFVARIDALHAGRYRLSIGNRRAQRFAREQAPAAARPFVSTTWVEVGPPEGKPAEATVEFALGGTLGVRIDDPEVPEYTRAPIPPAQGTIEVVAGNGERHAVIPFRFRGFAGEIPLLPGEYTVRVRTAAGRSYQKDASVRAAETTLVGLGAQ